MLIYLACVTLVGLPVMAAEILMGRASQKSPVSAFRDLSRPGSPWVSFGALGVAGSFLLLSYYSVVAGWALHYSWLSLTGELVARGPDGMQPLFQHVYESAPLNLIGHLTFMAMTTLVVLGGVAKGLERWSRILMPALFVMMLILLAKAFTLEGFGRGFAFVFGLHTEQLSGQGVLEALGQAFFTLSLGMGSMITYGSYLRREDDIMSASITICALDTVIALLAATVLFPIIFTYGMEPAQGPGLVFITIPIALAQMPAGSFLASVFFLLLVFAALTSSISMLEVATSYFIDERNWSRAKATWISGGAGGGASGFRRRWPAGRASSARACTRWWGRTGSMRPTTWFPTGCCRSAGWALLCLRPGVSMTPSATIIFFRGVSWRFSIKCGLGCCGSWCRWRSCWCCCTRWGSSEVAQTIVSVLWSLAFST